MTIRPGKVQALEAVLAKVGGQLTVGAVESSEARAVEWGDSTRDSHARRRRLQTSTRVSTNMSINPAPNPLPSQYEPHGVVGAIQELYECGVKRRRDHEVLVPTDGGWWSGFVHEFELSGHPEAGICYAVIRRGHQSDPELHTFLQDDRVSDAEEAVRWMLAGSE